MPAPLVAADSRRGAASSALDLAPPSLRVCVLAPLGPRPPHRHMHADNDSRATILGLNRCPVCVPGRRRGAAATVGARAPAGIAQWLVGLDPGDIGNWICRDRQRRRNGQRGRAHIYRAGRGAAAGRARAGMADARGTPGAGPARAGLGRSRRSGRRECRDRVVGAQLCGARRHDRRRDADAVAGAGDRRDGIGRLGAGDLRPAAAAQQRLERRASPGGSAAVAGGAVRVGADGLWRSVRRGCARGVAGVRCGRRARGGGRARARRRGHASVPRRVAGGAAGDRVRSAVLRRGRAAGDRADSARPADPLEDRLALG